MVEQYFKPHYLTQSPNNRTVDRAILERSDQWSPKVMERIFAGVWTPNGQQIKDIPRFMAALKRAVEP